jgi:hypothetical protein
MKYIPSPVPLQYNYVYSAITNGSGRMQYYRITPGMSKTRISRAEFIRIYNESPILAITPLPLRGQDSLFQFEFYI